MARNVVVSNCAENLHLGQAKEDMHKSVEENLRAKTSPKSGMPKEIDWKREDPCTDHSDDDSDSKNNPYLSDDDGIMTSCSSFKLTQKPRSLRNNGVKKRTWGCTDMWKTLDAKPVKKRGADRVTRHSKKRLRQEIASDGDVEWEAVTGESGETTSTRKKSTRCKTGGGLSLSTGELNGEIAAVTVGLQSNKPSAAERIQFKDVLRRRGGLQEYLDSRNFILALWERDIRFKLSITDCGLSAVASVGETPQESLLRDIYDFLNYHGYINLGIISKHPEVKFEKHTCKMLPTTINLNDGNDFTKQNKRTFLEEEGATADFMFSMNNVSGIGPEPMDIDENFSVSVKTIGHLENHIDEQRNYSPTQSGDGESLLEIANRVKAKNKKIKGCLPKLEHNSNDTYAESSGDLFHGLTREETVSNIMYKNEDAESICKGKGCNSEVIHAVADNSMTGISSTDISIKLGTVLNEDIHISGEHCKEQITKTDHNQIEAGSLSIDDNFTEDQSLSYSHAGASPKVIIVGAGPAGLTAGKHLQNLNVSVTILEARKRVGGRVFTDRSVFSGPVDLGASIITGVEADVSSERRPDPTALLCRQLDLELTTLGGDCPLFDSVLGTKVPSAIDEALEAEYNSLLDETVILVAQNGDVAMQMSLEEGLELALKRRKEQWKITTVARGADGLSGSNDAYEPNEIAMYASESNVSAQETLSTFSLERRVMDWHFANLEYGCAAELNRVSLPYWNQDDVYGGFAGPHCMIKGGYGTVMEALAEGLPVHFDQVVTKIEYNNKDNQRVIGGQVKIHTSNGGVFVGDAVLITIPLGCLKANTIDFEPSLPGWKSASIQRLGFGVLNKVIMEFPAAFWDEKVDFFGATAEHRELRGRCFMFWNLQRTVGAPILSALVVGKAAIEEEKKESSESAEHALAVLRSIFGKDSVPQPTRFTVTKWGSDPYSRGAYSYVAVGSSGEDYDIIGRSVDNCVFFAGEATCKEHPDTVGGAIMTGLREAVRIVDVLYNKVDSVAEAEIMAISQRQSDTERNEVRDMMKRLNAAELSLAIRKDGGIRSEDNRPFNKAMLLHDMFQSAKTISGRLLLAKEMLQLPSSSLEGFAGTKEGLTILNNWIKDSLGKDATQLLRHCVRLLLVVGKDLPSVRQSGIGRTVKEKVVVHTSRDIRAVASQLVKLWVETFRREKAAGKITRPLQQSPTVSRSAFTKPKGSQGDIKPGTISALSRDKMPNAAPSISACSQLLSEKEVNFQDSFMESRNLDLEKGKSIVISLNSSQGEIVFDPASGSKLPALGAVEAAVAAANAAAKALESTEAVTNQLELPKIVSFHKFANKWENMTAPESVKRKSLEKELLVLHGKGQLIMGIDARNCKVRDWSIDFSDNCNHLHSPDITSAMLDIKDAGRENELPGHSSAWIERDVYSSDPRQCSEQQEATCIQEFRDAVNAVPSLKDYENGKTDLVLDLTHTCDPNFCASTNTHLSMENHDGTSRASLDVKSCSEEEIPVAKLTDDAERPSRGSEHKKAVTDYISNLLLPLYKARKIDKDGFKSIVKKSAVKVIERQTEQEAAMEISQFLDTKRKIKIRMLVDTFVERYLENLMK
ncbi:hypothetical protein KP509_12G094400 [Ceratopteris richardii]|uniref:SWIRM domain-containing protein n=2 Tax=Ceratopteris richardii TaxID=49495 RepID=A0A8T2TRY9_CERRI|nr:hypothetical protein KP509_12G094400 [Ceratopteris richardii]